MNLFYIFHIFLNDIFVLEASLANGSANICKPFQTVYSCGLDRGHFQFYKVPFIHTYYRLSGGLYDELNIAEIMC